MKARYAIRKNGVPILHVVLEECYDGVKYTFEEYPPFAEIDDDSLWSILKKIGKNFDNLLKNKENEK